MPAQAQVREKSGAKNASRKPTQLLVSKYTPVNVDRLEKELRHHPNRTFVSYLIDGLRHGFHTGLYEPLDHPYICRNLLSALRNKEAVDITIADELRKGFIIGTFDQPPFDKSCVSPIGDVDKKYSPKKRLIVDLSAPHHKAGHPSINELIHKDEFSLSCIKIDDAKVTYHSPEGPWGQVV